MSNIPSNAASNIPDSLVRFFKAISNEDRLKIVSLLHQNKEMCAQEIEKHFFLEQSTTSHHLNTLKKADIVLSSKRGRHIFYSLNQKSSLSYINMFKELIS